MIIKKNNEIIMDHGDLILSDLSNSNIEVIYDVSTKEYYYYHDNRIDIELDEYEKNYINHLIEKYNLLEDNGLIRIDSNYFKDELL